MAALAGLDREAIAAERWFGAKGRTIRAIELEDAFELEFATGHVLAIATVTLDDGSTERYSFGLTGRPVRVARPGDGVWRALAAAMAEGQTVPAMRARGATNVTAALVCRPGRAMPRGIARAPERDLGADQSNMSVVLDERVLVKAYRRIQPGLNPELELVAFLAEEAGFPAVPPLAGFAEVVSARHGASTVAIAQTYIGAGTDAFEAIAEALVAWLVAPGEVSLEYATEVVLDLGTLTAGMHAALSSARGVPELAPRDATRKEIEGWAKAARRHLAHALDVTPGEAGKRLRAMAPAIAEALTTLRALPTTPRVIRAHGDYHLGQVLIAHDGYRVIDFEGDPLESMEARRAHRSPLRDVASMLRSLDHVGRTAGRRAEQRNGGPLARPGVDMEGWFVRARERFLEAYQAGLREAGGVPTEIDIDLLRAFEIDKETTEFSYAATYLPTWLWAPTEGMTWLIEGPGAPATR